MTTSWIEYNSSSLLSVWQPLLDKNVLWLGWNVTELLKHDSSGWWWDWAALHFDVLLWNTWWWLWWSLTVDNWWWSASSAALLTEDDRWSWWDLGLSFVDDQITWLRALWWVQPSDSDLLGVVQGCQLLLDNLWVRVVVDLVLLNWLWALEVSLLILVQLNTAVLASLNVVTSICLDWLLSADNLLLNVAMVS